MRNHAFLYLVRPDGEVGELDLLAESNSTWPVLWTILFAQTSLCDSAALARVFEYPVESYLAADASAALHRYERVARALQAPHLVGMTDVRRYLSAVERHLRENVQSYIVEGAPAPLFIAVLDQFSAHDPQHIRAAAARWWDEFAAAEQGERADVLLSLCVAGSKRRGDAWRAWSADFGFALFVQPYFAESFRKPRADDLDARITADFTSEGAWPQRHGLAVILRNDRYGYTDAHGQDLVPTQFDEADDFSAHGVARVCKQRSYGLLRADGSYALPVEYDQIDWRPELGGWLCRRATAYTLLHADGSSWVSTPWDAIEALVPERLLRVRRGNTVGALLWSGARALACDYTSLVARSAQDSIQLLARQGERMGLIDSEGRERVPFLFAGIEELAPHIEGAEETPQRYVRVTSLHERSRPKAGVWDLATARMVVPCEYDFVWSTLLGQAGRCGFLVANRIAYEGTRQADRYRIGVLDSEGRVLIPVTYAWLAVKADLGKAGAFERVREALFWAWSRGQPVQACVPATHECVWIAAAGVQAGAHAPELATLRHPEAQLTPMSALTAAAFYQFVELPDYRELRAPLLARCEALQVKGTILLAAEGINGTIAGAVDDVRAVLAYLRSDPRLADLEHKESPASGPPFYRMKVRLKREIVTLGVAHVNAARMAGTYVKPEDWNALIDDPDVVVIDARNDYEVALGTFEGALNPQTRSFRELPAWLRAQSQLQQKPKVAMFCTGGIRCEKSTAFLRSEGFEHVYHLQGGILKYLETMPEERSRWQGECFVFDERVTIGHGLKPGAHELCRSCREPIGAHDKTSPLYVEGVSCPKCFHQRSDEKKRGLLERQRQVELAKGRNDSHIGVRQELKRQAKRQRRAS